MSPQRHPWGCTCKTHVGRPWDRSEHWSPADVDYLDGRFGLTSDEAIAKALGRTVVALRLKAKRLGLHKRNAAMSGRQVAQIFGVDSGTIGKIWVRRGLMRSRRPFAQGLSLIHLVTEAEVTRFIREHPEYVDVEKMPDSWYRDLAARNPWISLVEVHRRTGRMGHAVAQLIAAGEVRGRRRGTHWYVPAADVPTIRPLTSADAIEESTFRRESNLTMRRNRRKGSLPRLSDGRSSLPAVQRVAS